MKNVFLNLCRHLAAISCCISVLVWPFSSYAQDLAPEINFSLPGVVTSTAGVFEITGTSFDDSEIVLNRLYVRNLITGQYWNGSEWVNTWSWFDL